MAFNCEPLRARWEIPKPENTVPGDLPSGIQKRYLEVEFHGNEDPRLCHTLVYVSILDEVAPMMSGTCKCGEPVQLRHWFGSVPHRGPRVLVERRELHLIGCLTVAEGVCAGLLGTVMANKLAMDIFMRLFINRPGRFRKWLDTNAPGAFRYFGSCRTRQGDRKLDKRLKCHISRDEFAKRVACGRAVSKVSRYTVRPEVKRRRDRTLDPDDVAMHHLGINDPGYCSECLKALGQEPPEL